MIDQSLQVGIVVHRSLGESVLPYANQENGEIDGESTIVISGTETFLVSRTSQAWQRFQLRFSRGKSRGRLYGDKNHHRGSQALLDAGGFDVPACAGGRCRKGKYRIPAG